MMKKSIMFFCVMGLISLSVAAPEKSGTFKDPRDNKTYKTVQIGKQTWMAENLNLHMEGSWCYDYKKENCKLYGRLYTWKKAMNACPEGWHLPSRGDWRELEEYVDANSKKKAGNALRSKDDWKIKKKKKKVYDQKTGEAYYLDEYEIINSGTDEFGFAALPGGHVSNQGEFVMQKEKAVFWTSSKDKKQKLKKAYSRQLEYGNGAFEEGINYMENALSVRCIKDSQ